MIEPQELIALSTPLKPLKPAEERVFQIVAKLFPPSLDQVGVKFTNPLQVRKDILDLEAAMELASDYLIKFKTTHRFINGIYAREVFIPKGSLLIGRIHKHACISIMNSGDKSTLSEDGAARIKAPFATISKPGIKRVGYAHEDTIWTTIHATNERDLKKVEDELFCDHYDGVIFDDPEIITMVTSEGKTCRQ